MVGHAHAYTCSDAEWSWSQRISQSSLQVIITGLASILLAHLFCSPCSALVLLQARKQQLLPSLWPTGWALIEHILRWLMLTEIPP